MRTITGERWVRGGALVAAVAAWTVLAGGIAPAYAITTPDCLAKKLKAWGNLRQCQRNAEAKTVQGRGADRAACQERFATVIGRDPCPGGRVRDPLPLSRQRRQHGHGLRHGAHVGQAGRARRLHQSVRRPRRRQHVHAGRCRGGGRVPHRHERQRHHAHPGARGRLAHRLALADDRRAADDRGHDHGRLPGGRTLHRSDLRVDGPRVLLGVDDGRRQHRIPS